MNITTQPRTDYITSNDNISFPCGTILTSQKYYDHLSLEGILRKHKSRRRNINSLVKAPVSYKLTKNQSKNGSSFPILA